MTSSGVSPVGLVDVVLSHSEVNNRYGTGILIQHMFPRHRENVVSVRAVSIWQGQQKFGVRQLVIPAGLDRAGIYAWTLAHTSDLSVRHIYCIPYAGEEITAALALRDAHRVPFCLYVMDDQNVASPAIPDELVAEAIDKARLRLAISSDMRDAYEAKYKRKFWVAPPTIRGHAKPVTRAANHTGRGILVGNISTQEWLDALLAANQGSELEVDWYANSPGGGFWLRRDSLAALGRVGITLREPLPEDELAARLADYEVALLPTMPERGRYENFAIASLSFPSRVSFLVGASDLPIIALGDPAAYVARFVDHYSLGINCRYHAADLDRAIAMTREPAWRRRQAASLIRLRSLLGETDIAAWLPDSLMHGAPIDRVFETLDVKPPRFVARYINETPSLGPWLHDYDPARAALARMAAAGYAPDFVIDVGASTGVWSHAASQVFPRARFVLIDPLHSRYDAAVAAHFVDRFENFEVRECALGRSDGEGWMDVGSNLYGSSLGAGRSEETLPVRVRALDSLARELGVVGQGLVKLDIQGGELDALRGADHLLSTSVDAVVVEVTLDPVEPGKPSYDDVHRFLRELGFVLFDNLGCWRSPESGMLLEQDVLLIKRDHPLAEKRRRDATLLAESLRLIQSATWPLRRGGNGQPRRPDSDSPPRQIPDRASPF